MTIPQILQALAIFGVGGICLEVVKRLAGWLSGRGPARRNEIERAWDSRDKARRERDEEARKRRIAEECCSQQRRLLLEAPCVDDSTIPAFPTYSKES